MSQTVDVPRLRPYSDNDADSKPLHLLVDSIGLIVQCGRIAGREA